MHHAVSRRLDMSTYKTEPETEVTRPRAAGVQLPLQEGGDGKDVVADAECWGEQRRGTEGGGPRENTAQPPPSLVLAPATELRAVGALRAGSCSRAVLCEARAQPCSPALGHLEALPEATAPCLLMSQ